MAKMVLGGHTFAHNPNEYRPVYPATKGVATGHTLESEFLLDFGFRGDGFAGQQYELVWRNLSRTEFNALRDLRLAGGEIVWDPKDHRAHEPGATYLVVVLDCYCDDYAVTINSVRDVHLVLEIKAAV